MILAMLGMAVGTGNIWRFPRIAAQNGGGEFLVAWIVFLFLWSIPLILVEFGLGRETRSGAVGAVRGDVARGEGGWELCAPLIPALPAPFAVISCPDPRGSVTQEAGTAVEPTANHIEHLGIQVSRVIGR